MKKAERDFEEQERVLVRELDEIRDEGGRLIARYGSSANLRRLEELEERDDDIVHELDTQQDEVSDKWWTCRERFCELFDLLDDIFVRSGLLPKDKIPEGDGAEAGAGGSKLHQPLSRSRESALRKSESLEKLVEQNKKLLAALSSKGKLFAVLREAIKENRHMGQLEQRVRDLDEAQYQNLHRIRASEEAISGKSPASTRSIIDKPENLKAEQAGILKELNRFQEDAEVKWVMMRDVLREALGLLDDVFLVGGELDGEEGTRDIDHARPLIEEFKEWKEKGQMSWPLPNGPDDWTTEQSNVSPKNVDAKRSFPKLTRSGETHRDLRAEVRKLQSEIAERVQLERQLVEKYAMALRGVEDAQEEFDLQEERHDHEEDEFRARMEAGEDVGSPSEFDLQMLLDGRRLTRNLIEAEEELEEAKKKAMEEGVDLGDSEQSSGFADRASDGYRESREAEFAEEFDEEEILEWIGSVPVEAPRMEEIGVLPAEVEPPELDDWDARSVDVSDSVSVVARGSERRRIDHWRKRLEGTDKH